MRENEAFGSVDILGSEEPLREAGSFSGREKARRCLASLISIAFAHKGLPLIGRLVEKNQNWLIVDDAHPFSLSYPGTWAASFPVVSKRLLQEAPNASLSSLYLLHSLAHNHNPCNLDNSDNSSLETRFNQTLGFSCCELSFGCCVSW